MPRHATEEITIRMEDFSRGIMGGVSERGIRRPNWLSAADNLYGRPYRGTRVRPGSRNISSASLSNPPHSLMAFYSGGGNKLFVAESNVIREVTSTAYVLQTLPATHPAGSDIWSHINLNGLLITTQRGGDKVPIQYDGTWKELKLPKPAALITFAADSSPGSVDAGTHFYRIRWRFRDGSSLAGTVSAPRVVANPNNTVNINGGLAASSRSDYLGWTLERTKVNGTVNGPFWFVADGNTTTYADTKSDAQLGYMADEGLHGEAPHFDGITAFAGRLWGWVGSNLQCSQAIGDLEATGIANFDAELLFPIAKDDGDSIQACIVVIDELLILKRRSVHVISGTDPESFVLRSIVYADPARGSEAGCGGPRAVCVIGGKAYFWGESGGLFSYQRGGVQPEAWSEMGRYLDEINGSALDFLVLINHQGNYIIAWYPRGASTESSDQVVYDARFKQWWHWKGWTARDAIELKGGLFGNATLVYCDPANRSTFPAIAAGSPITEAFVLIGELIIPMFGAVPVGTTVVFNVPSGATELVMSQNALATLQNITLIINGVEVTSCNTVAGSPIVTASGYRVLAAMDGYRDNRDSSGFFGDPVPWMMETPWLDHGLPDDWKDLDRVSFSAESDQVSINIAIKTDPPGGDSAIGMTAAGEGNDWAPDSGSNPNDLEWDVGDWAADAPTTSVSGAPQGTIGKRFKFVVTANASGDSRPSGLEAVAVLLPDKEYAA